MKDSGLIYIAQNAARHPSSPLEPLFRALYMINSSFDIRSIDVITDRNNIRKLLSFVNPALNSYEPESFTIDIEVIKNTAIFCRDAATTHEFLGPNDFRGFGHEFEKKYTTQQLSDSTGHHRIISYCFWGLNFIIRHETDGYVSNNTGLRGESEISSLYGKLEKLSISSAISTTNSAVAGSELSLEEGGRIVPHESTLEIKTRSTKKPLNIPDIAPQVWVSQTPKLVRAYHNRGKFHEAEVEDIAAQIKNWEAANQTDLRKLGELIQKLILAAKNYGGKATVTYDVRGDKLLIQAVDGAKMLPDDLYLKWDDESGSEETSKRLTKPGLASGTMLVNDAPSASTKGQQKDHDNISFSDVIKVGLDKGFRQFFRRMPTKLSEYQALCNSLKVLAIDVPQGRQIRDIMGDLRRGKSDWDPEEHRKIAGEKGLARDSAFRLLYAFLQEDVKDSNAAYNAALFVVSHRNIFRYRTRKMVREAYAYRFTASPKQLIGLDKWPIRDDQGAGSQEEDVTTEEDEIYYNSDSSF